MNYRIKLLCILLVAQSCIASCAHVSNRLPQELSRMHDFLSEDDPGKCRKYHYNFERHAPRLYQENQIDSILSIVDFIKNECGPSADLEVVRLLLLMERDGFNDTLIGSATIPQMLWHRSKEERLLRWSHWDMLYGSEQPLDNTHDRFTEFITKLAAKVGSAANAAPSQQAIGLFYSGEFDSAFSKIQSRPMVRTALRENYAKFVEKTKKMFPTKGNVAFFTSSWRPRGANRLLGNHPEFGMQVGGEGRRWRSDFIVSYRFSSSKNRFVVDSLGTLVSTDEFNSWFIGLDGGYKFLDTKLFSADIFVGLAYDVLLSVTKDVDPKEYVNHRSLAASVGLRQRVFLNQKSGWYLGGMVRYSVVNYGNPRGTDLSGHTLTFSVVTGWSFQETLGAFLNKLNYKGNRRK